MTGARILFSIMLFSAHWIGAQNIELLDDYLYTISRQQASTRAESMGHAGVANGGTVQETRMNPASLGFMEQKLLTEYSNSSPVFFDNRANYLFLGIGVKLNPKMQLAYSEYRCHIYQPILGFTKGNKRIMPHWIKENNHMATFSMQLNKHLSAGINATLFENNVDSSGNFRSFFVDAGMLWNKDLRKNTDNKKVLSSLLKAGLSVSNINQANAYYNIKGLKDTANIYGVLRAGVCWQGSFNLNKVVYGKAALVPISARTFDVLVQTQYLKYLNTDLPLDKAAEGKILSHGFNTGIELAFFKILMLRAGYRYEKRSGNTDPNSNLVNYPYLKGFTNGFGIRVPLQLLAKAHLPFALQVDVCHQKPFNWVKNFMPYPYYRTTSVSVRLNWYLNEK